ncbi:MAG TPA: erythromycin esterase family protein [Fimbriimonas sp.]
MTGIEELARPIRERSVRLDSLDPFLGQVAESRYVLLGEASHGTHEYYAWRSKISRRLIEEKGFRFIAVEGDWPACYEINRYVKGWSDASTAYEVLSQFDRWPTWMWANWEVVELAEWLRDYNRRLPGARKVGFYGLDVYSLWESIEAVLRHLQENHPHALPQAHEALQCFEPFNRDVQTYAWSTRVTPDDCEEEVVGLLRSMRSLPAMYPDDPESHFNAEQNAEVAVGAERYYRAMMAASNESWNIRDTHMADTLDRLVAYHEGRHGGPCKAVVWEHNTHIGDARATDMAAAGMTNIGQIARERHLDDGVVLAGFGSYEGSVVAGESWGAPMEKMQVPKARDGSWEQLFHDAAGGEDRFLDTRALLGDQRFRAPRGHRAIGVVYHPERERYGNYVPTDLPLRYDAFFFIDETQALHPLHIEAHAKPEPPETYPWGV